MNLDKIEQLARFKNDLIELERKHGVWIQNKSLIDIDDKPVRTPVKAPTKTEYDLSDLSYKPVAVEDMLEKMDKIKIDGNALRRLVKRRKIKIKALAKEIGVGSNTLYGFFDGAKQPTREQVLKLAKALSTKQSTFVDNTQKKLFSDKTSRVPVNGEKVKKLIRQKYGIRYGIKKASKILKISHTSLLRYLRSNNKTNADPVETVFLGLCRILNVKPKEIVGTHYRGQNEDTGKPYMGRYKK